MTLDDLLQFPPALIDRLHSAQAITVLTGAGISAESGIPTFRDSQAGLWAQYNPQDLATPEAFQDNPRLVLDWYRWRRSLIMQSKPNAGHEALVAMEERVPHFTLITQNVDGLHQLAGSRNIIELHGNIHQLRCPQDDLPAQPWGDQDLTYCPHCGSLLRPNVVWFGEQMPVQALQIAQKASIDCDVFLSIGTSGMVEPAASLPYEALRAKIVVVEINPSPTPLTVYTAYYFAHPAGEVLPALVAAAWPQDR